jgi:hypothetical protein
MASNKPRRVLSAVLIAIAGSSGAAEVDVAPAPGNALPPIGEQRARNFLAHAKRVDRSSDPLTRCLAFPDIPGNAWPEGLAEAHCKDRFGPRIRGEDVRQALAGGDLALLDARFAADLAKHAAVGPYSEAIHHDFESFDGGAQSAEMSEAWLAKAPGSAFALAARATHFRNALDTLRGGRFATDVKNEEWAAMSRLAAQAIDLYGQALVANPGLIEAHVGMVNVARLDDRNELQASVLAKAVDLDPTCFALADQAMRSLTPQWNGSYGAMQAYGKVLEAHLAQRPLLALVIERPRLREAAVAQEQGRYEDAAKLAGTVVKAVTEPSAAATLAVASEHDATPNLLDSLVYAVAATRFDAGGAGMARMRGAIMLTRLNDADWAVPALEFAVKESPHDGIAHLYLGRAYAALVRGKEARAEFALAAIDPLSRGGAMQSFTRMLVAESLKPAAKDQWIETADAIQRANEGPPGGVEGTFVLTVQATGSPDGRVYLNSAADYKDPRCLTIAINPDVVKVLTRQLGDSPLTALRSRTILVRGLVYKVPIFMGRVRTVPAYYQTHVEVVDAGQITIVPAS